MLEARINGLFDQPRVLRLLAAEQQAGCANCGRKRQVGSHKDWKEHRYTRKALPD